MRRIAGRARHHVDKRCWHPDRVVRNKGRMERERERWKVNHSHMWSVGTAIWTLHLISSPSPLWLCYEFYLHFLPSLILYVISCPFVIAIFLPPPIHLSPSCLLLKLFLNFQTSLPFALLLYFPLSVLCLVSFESGQMSCRIQSSTIHFWS